MKLMGIDYGRRRIGLAVTDEEGYCVRGLDVIDRKKTSDIYSELKRIIDAENPAQLVIGLPLDVEDRETVMSTEIRKFAAELKNRVTLPVNFIDESLSSKNASEFIKFRKKKERRDKALVDRVAACLILERYIEENK